MKNFITILLTICIFTVKLLAQQKPISKIELGSEIGTSLNSLYHFRSNTIFSEDYGRLETKKISSSIPFGFYFNASGKYNFNKYLGIETGLAIAITHTEQEHEVDWVVESYIFTKEEWSINVKTRLWQVPLIAVLNIDEKQRFSFGAGTYIKKEFEGVRGSAFLKTTENYDESLSFNEPQIITRETIPLSSEKGTYNYGWLIQASFGCYTRKKRHFFYLKINYQRDFNGLNINLSLIHI